MRYDYQYEYKKAHSGKKISFTNQIQIKVYLRYNDESLIENLAFDHIDERHFAKDFKYVIGEIKLEHVIDHLQDIAQSGAFIAFAGQVSDIKAV